MNVESHSLVVLLAFLIICFVVQTSTVSAWLSHGKKQMSEQPDLTGSVAEHPGQNAERPGKTETEAKVETRTSSSSQQTRSTLQPSYEELKARIAKLEEIKSVRERIAAKESALKLASDSRSKLPRHGFNNGTQTPEKQPKAFAKTTAARAVTTSLESSKSGTKAWPNLVLGRREQEVVSRSSKCPSEHSKQPPLSDRMSTPEVDRHTRLADRIKTLEDEARGIARWFELYEKRPGLHKEDESRGWVIHNFRYEHIIKEISRLRQMLDNPRAQF
jgi:hypothetical protein